MDINAIIAAVMVILSAIAAFATLYGLNRAPKE